MSLTSLLTEDVEVWRLDTSGTPDAKGNFTDSYALHETRKARIEWETGREFIEGRWVTAQRVVIYLAPAADGSADVSPRDRLRSGGREYDVVSAAPMYRRGVVHHVVCELEEVL